ncbi:uncharacterized protein LOC122390938 [Amphibalanus amphitrite]|uniref:uncharacterized protein LOC122390938 n=1 Tax=Amphibalanus amphitrite TaxID=1232801 RepID=UPI001C920513|nr:uncharacterized protein LOC122390938 [Amphibalanus amphitrite]
MRKMSARTRLGLLLCLLTVSDSRARISTESVFATDQAVLEGSPATLRARHCLTDDYTTSEGEEAAAVAAALQRCVQRLERGGLEPACDGVPVVSLLYVCLANR